MISCPLCSGLYLGGFLRSRSGMVDGVLFEGGKGALFRCFEKSETPNLLVPRKRRRHT